MKDSDEVGQKIQAGEIPDYLKKYRTKDSIPAFFRDADSLPSRLAVSDDRTPAAKVVNQSYERQKKIEQKRATENNRAAHESKEEQRRAKDSIVVTDQV